MAQNKNVSTICRDTSGCFGCGKANPIGLRLVMTEQDGRLTAQFTPRPEHASYGDRMHGGLISTILDEVMGEYVFRQAGIPAYTARLALRFHSAVRIGETVTASGWIVSKRGRLYSTAGCLRHADGTLAAEANAKMMTAKQPVCAGE